MPAPRLPAQKAKTSGADLKNPKRFKDRKAPQLPKLGLAPPGMKEDECKAWSRLVLEIPWLNTSHTSLVAIAARIRAKMDTGQEVGISAMSLLMGVMSKLGATPVDETKVNHGDDGDGESAEDKFFN